MMIYISGILLKIISPMHTKGLVIEKDRFQDVSQTTAEVDVIF